MNQNHPKIKIDYSIIGKSENEKDIKIRETIIVENIVKQFFEYHYSKNTQNIIEKENFGQIMKKNRNQIINIQVTGHKEKNLFGKEMKNLVKDVEIN